MLWYNKVICRTCGKIKNSLICDECISDIEIEAKIERVPRKVRKRHKELC